MISNGMTIEQELERYKSWLEDRNIELKETKNRLEKIEKLLKLYQYLNENTNDYDLNPDEVDEIHNKIYELEEELKWDVQSAVQTK